MAPSCLPQGLGFWPPLLPLQNKQFLWEHPLPGVSGDGAAWKAAGRGEWVVWFGLTSPIWGHGSAMSLLTSLALLGVGQGGPDWLEINLPFSLVTTGPRIPQHLILQATHSVLSHCSQSCRGHQGAWGSPRIEVGIDLGGHSQSLVWGAG